ncbi:MAG TPA: penicillin-binding transpeptidase domain-containing protein, partial [Gammaproteobacteria bacterium]|nr:penicillin-binding transpeptidase domain-containing protein [Gammaproteobacteria bacterium]
LQIFTTLNPLLQETLEKVLSNDLAQLESSRNMPENTLEGAAVVTSVEGNEVLAMVGGRNARYAGYNRALTAVRPIGSLIKPVVYLTLLANTKDYTWATTVDDTPLEVQMPDGRVWEVNNYANEYHGEIPLYKALVHSWNVPTVRVGLNVGVTKVADTLQALGFSRSVNPFPSLLLGAVAMSPFEVSQIYNTLAAGGFRTPPSAIREVLTASGEPLQRYPLQVKPVADPSAVYLVNKVLQLVVERGTASSVNRRVESFDPAGKTGTTDDFRDSWFAGFSGNHVAVVWVGRDDNKPINLTGSSGALQIWADFMTAIPNQPYHPIQPQNVESAWINPETGSIVGENCNGAVKLPFITGTVPEQTQSCGALRQFLEGVFD